MLDSNPPDSHRSRLVTVILAAVVLLIPPLIARVGPDPVRTWVQGLSLGVWSGLGGEHRFLRFDAQYRSLGELKGQHRIEFAFENRGDRGVVLARSTASCGCVRVELPSGPIAPGGRGKVVLHLDTKEQLPGPIWMLARIYTDLEPLRPFLLHAEGEVQ